MQIKEKYGTLRVYAVSSIKEVSDLIEEYEIKSKTICKICGKTGSLHINKSKWLAIFCDDCSTKQGYIKID